MITAGAAGRRSLARDLAAAASGFEAVAAAAWLLPASVHIVGWPDAGPQRVALLASTRSLAILSVIALLAAALAAGSGRQSGVAARAESLMTPVSLFWLWVLPYLPWLPDRLPLLLVLAGPARWVVAAAVVGSVANRMGAFESLSRLTTAIDRRTAFALSLAAYVSFGLYSVRTNGLGGDEPHYLIIAESLLKDGDLQIENNHARRDYRSFFGGDLRPDYMQRGRNGQIYSIHAPGLPALLLPAYALGGRYGVVVFLCALGALAAAAIFDLAERIADRRAAVITWAGVCLTVPFVPYSWLIFPEMPAALVVAWSALWLWRPPEASLRTWLWRGAALGALPWLHTKFVVLLGILAAALAVRLLNRPRALLTLLAPVAISGGLWLYSFYVIYGVMDPEAPYGTYSRLYLSMGNIPHGLIGLFLDQKFGLLFYSPLYLIAILGGWLMLRGEPTRYLGGVLLLTAAAFVASTTRLYMFWGGSSAPARFLVPILPCLAPMVAVSVKEAARPAARALIGLWLSIGLVVAALGVGWPSRLMLFSDPHGRARLLEALQAGSPLALLVPTFTDPDWADQIGQLLPWLLAGVLGLMVLAVAGSRRRSLSAWTLAGATVAAFTLSSAVLVARPSADARAATAQRGAMDLIWRYDGSRFRPLNYVTLRRTTAKGLRELSTLALQTRPDRADRGGYVTAPITLPPGVYEAVVSFESSEVREGEVAIVSAPSQAVFGRVAGSLPSPTRLRFELPVTARNLSVRVTDTTLGGAVNRIEIIPLVVIPPGQREATPVRAIESLPGPLAGHLIYTDEHAYPEGGVFWTRGTEETRMLVAPHGAARVVLTLFTGPASGTVIVSAAGRVDTVGVVAGSTREVGFDVPPGQRLLPVTIRSQTMFRPSEVDTTSTDTRGLGCQVRVRLE